MKKIIIPLVAIAIVAIAVFMLMQSKSNPAPDNSGNSNQTGKDFDPQHPNFIMGKVAKASASEISFQSGTVDYTAQLSPSTKLVKQVSVKGVVSVVDATLADFKTNS